MATVNITADMNAVDSITISDAAAAAGSILIQFFTDGKNVFNIASQDLSGDPVDAITVNDDTSYEFDISAEQAQLLDGVASTYKQYSLDGAGGKTLLNEGSVTVTPLTGGALATLVPFINGDRITTTGATTTALSAKADNDTIYLNPNNLTETVVTLPDADTMPGKIFRIKLIAVTGGTGAVKTPNASELIALETGGDNCIVISKGATANDWQLFSQYIQP